MGPTRDDKPPQPVPPIAAAAYRVLGSGRCCCNGLDLNSIWSTRLPVHTQPHRLLGVLLSSSRPAVLDSATSSEPPQPAPLGQDTSAGGRCSTAAEQRDSSKALRCDGLELQGQSSQPCCSQQARWAPRLESASVHRAPFAAASPLESARGPPSELRQAESRTAQPQPSPANLPMSASEEGPSLPNALPCSLEEIPGDVSHAPASPLEGPSHASRPGLESPGLQAGIRVRGQQDEDPVATPAIGPRGLELQEAITYDELGFGEHMVAGAAAGMMEHIVMYPVDTIKTRMQALAHPGQRLHGLHNNTARAIQAVLRREGWRGLYGGIGAVALGAGPAHALYFATYESVKDALGGNQPGHHPFASGLAGAAATVVNDTVMTPVDVIKQRLQVMHSPYKGILDCLLRVCREEGAMALFKSLRTTLVMNVPFTAIHFPVYESAKKLLLRQEGDEETLAVSLVAGGIAGGTAAGLTNPLDVVKTRLQLEGVNSATRYGTTKVLPTIRAIVREEGAGALLKGIQPRILFHAPAAAICWGTYETMKKLLGTLREPQP